MRHCRGDGTSVENRGGGGWYHVTARGNERRAVFFDDRDRIRFLELLGEWVERFGLRLHAYVLMENHYGTR